MQYARVRAFLTTFAVVFPAELPDKTALASLMLVATYRRPLAVWAGGASAFLVQCLIAVAAGRLLSLLPERVVAGVAAVLFATGAVLALRARGAEPEALAPVAGRRVYAVTFGVLFLAEWGDFTQLATASLSSRYDSPVGVFLGAWLALCTVCALAVVLGRGLLRVVPLRVVRTVAAGVFATVAVASAVQAAR